MYMENFEEFVEERDLDEDVQLKKDLIVKAKELSENEDLNVVFKQISSLQKQWRRIPNYESALDEQLQQEFEGYVDAVYAKRNELYKKNAEVKQGLVAKAKALANPSNFNQATNEMNALMNEWKATGSASKDKDDELWALFNEARQTFFDNKRKHYEDLQVSFANATEAKEQLVKEAKALESSENWKEASEQFKALMAKWKEIGNAGKDNENRLWNEFNGSYQAFNAKRNAYYDALHVTQADRATKKQELIAKAKEIVASNDYSKEHTQVMKNMTSEWKAIGSAGKEENALWAELRETVDAYFAGLKQAAEDRQNQWRQRMQETKARKAEMIANQMRQIKRLQQDMPFMYSERQMNEANEEIADKQAFIAELEQQIAEIDAKLNK